MKGCCVVFPYTITIVFHRSALLLKPSTVNTLIILYLQSTCCNSSSKKVSFTATLPLPSRCRKCAISNFPSSSFHSWAAEKLRSNPLQDPHWAYYSHQPCPTPILTKHTNARAAKRQNPKVFPWGTASDANRPFTALATVRKPTGRLTRKSAPAMLKQTLAPTTSLRATLTPPNPPKLWKLTTSWSRFIASTQRPGSMTTPKRKPTSY